MSLKSDRRIVALLAGATVLLALVAALSLTAFNRVKEPAAARKHAYVAINRAGELLTALTDAETGQRGYALTGDTAFLAPYLAVRDSVSGQLAALRRLTSTGEADRHLAAVEPLAAAKLAELARVIELRRQGNTTAVLAVVRGGEGLRLMDSIRVELRAFVQLEEGAVVQSETAFQSHMRQLFAMIVAASVLVLLLGLAIGALIYRERQHHLTQLVHLETRHALTVQEELNNQLRRQNTELESANRLKSEFLGTMSHELRTPLNAIIGFSEVLRDGLLGPLTEQQHRFVDDIFGSGKQLLSLINDILDLSRVDAGQMTLELEPVPISSLFASGISGIRQKAAARDIRIDYMDSAAGVGPIRVDARRVRQIVSNLLANAVKFSSDGGAVTLRVRRVARAGVGLRAGPWAGRSLPLPDSAADEFLEFSVSDSGIGMSPEGLDQLFTSFRQIDGGLARQFEGTGLGLALVRHLAELHGGTVAVESAVGEGSRFTVWLPLQTAGDPALTPTPAAPSRALPTSPEVRTALVIEDDAKSAALIRMQLEAEGFTVLHAATAEAGLTLAIQQPLSLITLDIMLPSMNGWQMLTRIKQVPSLAHVPVVIISIEADSHKGFALGAAAVLQKPISRQDLYQSLVELGLFPVAASEG